MSIAIHQIFYRESQRNSLDVSFLPYDNSGKTYPYNFEYAVFFDIYKTNDWEQTDLLGTVSWKFHQKTGRHGSEFLRHINENPGMDVYFINPFPELCIYESVWHHGTEFHPKILTITENLLRACNYPTDILHRETPPNLTSYCNYWVANKKFWDAYMDFLMPLWNYILATDNAVTSSLKAPADPFIQAPYLPFIFERLFSTFLSTSNFKVSSFGVCPEKLTSNPYLAPIASTIDRISKLDSHLKISSRERVLITLLSSLRKMRHYYAPLLLKKLNLRSINRP